MLPRRQATRYAARSASRVLCFCLGLLVCSLATSGTKSPGSTFPADRELGTTDRSTLNNAPNILFIYMDDLGWRDTGFMGSDFYETPNLDLLAEQSVVFEQAYSAAANCAPARASLLSGQYTPRHKIYNVGTGPRGKAAYRRLRHVPGTNVLDPEIRTWAHQLQQRGYQTGIFGKWHLSTDPLPYGFHVNVGGTHGGSPPNGYYPPHGKAPGLGEADPDEYLTDRLTSEAISFIEENRESPWCVYLSHFAVHTPLDAKRELLAKYRAKPVGELHSHIEMATMIEAFDTGVGRLVSKLDELQLRERTVILFYSDNGGFGPATDMHPLKGYKGTYYEGGIREPFFVYWPSRIKQGRRCDVPVTAVDIYPTLCEIAGAELPTGQVQDGVSLLPLIDGDAQAVDALSQRAIFWHFPAYLQSYQVWDEQRDPLFRSRPCSIIRQGAWKLHQYFEDGGLELYNLEQDVGEQNDLSEELPEKTAELLATLKQWQTECGADLPTEPNPKFDAQAEAAAQAEARARMRRKNSSR